MGSIKPSGTRPNLGRICMLAVMMVAGLAAYTIPYGFALDGAMTDTMPYMDDAKPSQARFDVDSIESRVQATVVDALRMYWTEGTAAFDMITPTETVRGDITYPFILNATTLEGVAYGAFPVELIGVVADTLDHADRHAGHILEDLERDGGTWVEYMATNPANGLVQPKRTWLYLHDGYVFGAGHYLTESRVKYVAEEAVQLYESKGQEAFAIITPEEALLDIDLYAFVFNATTLQTVAHGALPDRLGHIPYSIINTGDRPIESILADLERDGSTWTEYVFTNPATETKQLKRSWLYLYDGYIFSVGYYVQDSRVQSLVEEAVLLYKDMGREAFGVITPDAASPLVLQSAFVLDVETLETVAHGLFPNLVGTTDRHITAADRSADRIIEELNSKEGVWTWWMSQNPATRTDQLTRTYLSLHDGYIFGAGYSLPDSRVQSMIDEAIYTYRNDPGNAFDVITSGEINRLDIYPTARNTTHILAHGTLPNAVGPLPQLQLAESQAVIWKKLREGDGTLWSQFVFFSAYTGTDQIKRGWQVLHDGYSFASAYTVADADVRSVVDYAVFIYEYNKDNDAWVDIITPEEPVTTDDNYPFVFNATTLQTVAHGAFPDRLGLIPYSIINTGDRPIESILADLERDGSTWTEYVFTNPSTGTEQPKRAYLQMRDGLVFASGYYILDSQSRAIVLGHVLDYNNFGEASLAGISIPEVAVSTYAFVVDPETGSVRAQNADPDLLDMSDWEAITMVLPADDLLEELETETGAWADYTLANPVTGEVENKRAWLIGHDGLVFGSGYYASDLP